MRRVGTWGRRFAFVALLAGLAGTGLAQTFTSSTSFPGFSSTAWPITVSGLAGSVTKVTVKFTGLNITNLYDAAFLLVAPGGVIKLDLMSDVSATGDITLDDAQSSFLVSGNNPPSGTGSYKPTNQAAGCDTFTGFGTISSSDSAGASSEAGFCAQPIGTGTLANHFNGLSGGALNATWNMYAATQAAPNPSGTITSWSITFTTTGAGDTTTTTFSTNTPNPSFTSGTGSTITFTGSVADSANGGTTVNNGNVTIHDVTTNTNVVTGAIQSNGTFSLQGTIATEGAHDLYAVYDGGTGFQASQASNHLTQTVNNHATSSNGGFTMCNTGTITIPSGPVNTATGATPYPSAIILGSGEPSVTGGGIIEKLTVTLNNITFPAVDFLSFMLVSPSGKAFEFMSDVDGGGGASGINLIFDDNAANSLGLTSTPSSGTFKPSDCTNTCNNTPHIFPSPAPASYDFAAPRGSATLTQDFAGLGTDGTWKLYLANGAFNTTGSLGAGNLGWCLNFTMQIGAHPTQTLVSSSKNPAHTTTDAVTITATVTTTDNSGTVNSGAVTFSDGGVALASNVAVVNGVASFITSSLAEGTHHIVAQFGGTNSGTILGPSSGSVDQRIDNASNISVSGATYTYCNPGTITLPAPPTAQGPAGPYPSNIFVTNLPGTVKALTVTLKGFNANVPSWVDSLLVGPNGSGGVNTLDFFSGVGGLTHAGPFDLTFDDTAGSGVSGSSLSGGTFKPTSGTKPNVYQPCPNNAPGCLLGPPAPAGPYNYSQPQTPASIFGDAGATGLFGGTTSSTLVGNATWSLYQVVTQEEASNGSESGWCVNFVENPVTVTATKGHTGRPPVGNMQQGQHVGASFSFQITNNGPGPTGDPDGLHPLTVVDVLDASAFTPGTLPTGTPWNCTAVTNTVTCKSSSAIAQGSMYPSLVIPVIVKDNAPASATNQASLSGGGITATNSTMDTVTIDPAPILSISKQPSGTFTQGQTGTWTLQVANSNANALGNTNGTTVTVTDTLPTGYTGWTASGGANWTCITNTLVVTCTSNQVVAGNGGLFDLITLTGTVPATSPTSVTNNASVFGGGDVVHFNSGNAATDSSTVTVIQVPAFVNINGSPTQSALVGTAFGSLAVTVQDAGHVTIPNYASVHFTAMAGGSGQSGTFDNFTSLKSVTTGSGGSAGVADPGTFTANNIPGAYIIDVLAGTIDATFNLTNTAPDLTAVKSDNVSHATTLGTPWTWKVHIANSGTGPANFSNGATILTDNLPSTNIGYSAPSIQNISGITGSVGPIACGIANNTLTCAANAAISIASPGSFDVIVTATPTAIGVFANPTGGVCTVNPVQVPVESDFTNNSCSDTVTVTAPDLTAVKSDNVGGATFLGTPWTWKVHIANGGNGTATFTTGQTILTDNLPSTNIGYGSVTTTPTGITGTILCSIATSILTCTANGGSVTIPPAATVDVSFLATPTAIGIFANPFPPPDSTADFVYGQGGLFNTSVPGLSATGLNFPFASASDSGGNVYVADANNNRVLYYPAGTTTATRVYGQLGSFTTNTPNNGGITADSLNRPTSVAVDSGGNLYVADVLNNRVLYYLSGNTTATRVYGQSGSFITGTANNGGITADSLFQPTFVALDGSGNLYAGDQGNSRVLFYPAGSTTATRVYGQSGSFTSGSGNNGGTSANSLNSPQGVALDSGSNLYVADQGNNRVLYYVSGSTTATRVYGQSGSFSSGTANNGGIGANSLNDPIGIGVDSTGNLYVADANNNRALFYAAGSTTATGVYGQGGNLGTNTPNNGGLGANSLFNPQNAALDRNGNLYVADYSNNRVLRYNGGCTVDPSNLIVESNEGNNTCGDTVTVTAPDLTAVKTNNVSGSIALGSSWTWNIHVANVGNAPANFTTGQSILTDNLPSTNIGYGSASITNPVGIGGTFNCSISSSVLTCLASGGAASLAVGGSFDVSFVATPTGGISFANPTGGVCAADPANVVAESNEGNNSCSDTVTVNAPDLTAVKSDNVSHATTLGNNWTWNVHVANTGAAVASFTTGQTILTDNLPSTNINYGTAGITSPVGIGGTVNCIITSNVLTCSAGTAVTIAATTGAFDVSFTATPTAIGTFQNPPTGFTCGVDPLNVVAESNEGNNSCSDTVTVTAPDLTATKSNNVAGAGTSGVPWTWKVHLANIGNAPATFTTGQTILTDNLPTTNIVYGSASTSGAVGITGTGTIGCLISTNILTCTANGGSVIIGATTGVVDVSFSATASVAGSYANPTGGVCMVDPLGVVAESLENNNSCSDTVNVNSADLTAVKTNNVSGTVNLGTGWTWKVHVANSGSAAANFTTGQTILTDNLPSTNITYGSAAISGSTLITGTINCSISINVLSCTAGNAVTIGASTGAFDVSIPVNAPTATGPYANPTSGVCAVDPLNVVVESNEGNNSCSDTVTVTAVDLTAVKTDNVSHATTLGNNWTWTIHVANSGTTGANFASGNAVLTDNLPTSGLNYGSATMPASSGITGTILCSITSNVLTCSASGGAATIGAGGSFDVAFTATPTAIGVYQNPPTGFSCGVDPGNVVAESNEGNNSCSDTVTVTAPDLTAVKTNNTSGVGVQGSAWAWNIHVANTGNAPASFAPNAVILTDFLPSTNITYSTAFYANPVGVTGTVNCSITSNVLTCTASNAVTIPATTGAFDVTFNATPSATGGFVNPTGGVCAVDPGGVVTESNEGNNSCSDTVTVNAPDLTAVKTNNVGGNGTAGIPWTWKIHLANIGTAAASFTTGQTILTDNLPSTNIVYGAASTSNATGVTGPISCSIGGNILSCTASGGTVTFAATTAVIDVSFTATASVAASYVNPTSGVCKVDPVNNITESNKSNNSCSDTVVVGAPDLTAVKTDNVSNATTLGNGWTWKVHVGNSGTAAANFANGNTILTDNLPSTNIGYGSASMANASGITGTINCAIASNTLTCTANGPVAIAAAGGFDVSFTATPTALGSYANPTGGVCAVDPGNVVVEGNENNNACSDTVVVSAPDLTVSKTHSPSNFVINDQGDSIIVTVTNSGGAPSSGTVTVTDVLPNGLTYASFTGSGWSCVGTSPPNVTCTTTNAIAASGGTSQVTIKVNVAGNAGSPLTNNVSVACTCTESNTGNNSNTDQITVLTLINVTLATTTDLNAGTLQVSGDGGSTYFASPHTFQWIPNSAHTIVTQSPQGSENWVRWSDGGAISHSVSPSSSTTFTADFAGPTSLTGSFTARTGTVGGVRTWTFNVTNSGPGDALNTQITGVTLQQTTGTPHCNPNVTTSMPVQVGDLAAHGSAPANFSIDFTGCPSNAFFTATVGLAANSGVVHTNVVRTNQLQ